MTPIVESSARNALEVSLLYRSVRGLAFETGVHHDFGSIGLGEDKGSTIPFSPYALGPHPGPFEIRWIIVHIFGRRLTAKYSFRDRITYCLRLRRRIRIGIRDVEQLVQGCRTAARMAESSCLAELEHCIRTVHRNPLNTPVFPTAVLQLKNVLRTDALCIFDSDGLRFRSPYSDNYCYLPLPARLLSQGEHWRTPLLFPMSPLGKPQLSISIQLSVHTLS